MLQSPENAFLGRMCSIGEVLLTICMLLLRSTASKLTPLEIKENQATGRPHLM